MRALIHARGPPLRWGGIIVKTSLNVIDMASSLVRAYPSHSEAIVLAFFLSLSLSERLEVL